MGEQNAVIKDTDMPEEMQQQAVECAILAIEKYSLEREIAALIKRVNVCCWLPAERCVGSRSPAGGCCHTVWKSQFHSHEICGAVGSLPAVPPPLHIPFLALPLLFCNAFILSFDSPAWCLGRQERVC